MNDWWQSSLRRSTVFFYSVNNFEHVLIWVAFKSFWPSFRMISNGIRWTNLTVQQWNRTHKMLYNLQEVIKHFCSTNATIDSVIDRTYARCCCLSYPCRGMCDYSIICLFSFVRLTIRERRKKDWGAESTRGSRKAYVTRRERDGERLPREARQPWGDRFRDH